MDIVLVNTGDRVTMRKPHPCGSYEWSVTRTGADIGLQCSSCGRRVMLTRDDFERGVKKVASSGKDAELLSTGATRETSC
jgi:hypothetical protein